MRSKVYFISLSILLIAIPLLKGGNSEWARMGLVCFVVATSLVAYLLENTEDSLAKFRAARFYWLVWAVVTFWMLFQYFGLTLNQQSSPTESQAFGMFSPLNALNYWALFSVYWFIVWMAYSQSAQELNYLVLLIVIVAFFQAMYGLVAFIGKFDAFIGGWEREAHSLGKATGSFVNRNNFAGFLALCLPLGLSFFYSKQSISWIKQHPILRHGLAIVFLAVVLIAILGSQSRLGMFVAVIAMALWVYFYFTRSSEILKSSKIYAGVATGFIIIGLIWFGAGGLIQRLMNIDVDARTDVWEAMLSMPLCIWLFGVGGGGFEDVFRTIAPWHVQDSEYIEAHNDILEFVFGFGLLGTSLIVCVLIVWYRKTNPGHWSLVQYGALSGIFAITIHSLGEFNLQIPGVAVMFWVIVGILMNPNTGQLTGGKTKEAEYTKQKIRRRVRRHRQA